MKNIPIVFRQFDLRHLGLLFALLLFVSCAGEQVLQTPEVKFLKGKMNFDKALFANANTEFGDIITNYPETKYASYSYILIANSQFEGGVNSALAGKSLNEALRNYRAYIKFVPQSPLIPYALYRIMFLNYLTNVRGIFTVGTNPAVLEEIRDDYKRFFLIYPKNLYFEDSKYLLRGSLAKLASYEEKVGDWYYNRKLYNAASARYLFVLKNFPSYPENKRVANKLINVYNLNKQPYLAEGIEFAYDQIFSD